MVGIVELIVVDVETGGLDFQKNPILSIGAIDMADPRLTFYGTCNPREGTSIDDKALEINGFTKEQVLKDPTSTEELLKEFFDWCSYHKSDFTLAGENPSFDRDFIAYNARLYGIKNPFGHRTVDLHSVAYSHMASRGKIIPNENQKNKLSADVIFVYTGIPAEPRPHNALNGAVWEAEAFYRLVHCRGVLKQFSEYPVSVACLE